MKAASSSIALPLNRAVDELNMAEFPLAGISDRRLDGRKSITYEEQVFDRKERKYVTRRLTLAGSDPLGLPTAKDDDILLACLQLSRIQDFRSREVCFSRYEILRLLGLSLESKNYTRVATSLRRWKGLSIFSDRAFYDREAASWINRDFGVFDSVYLYLRESKSGSTVAAKSRFTWNDVLFNSFQSGYLKRFDWSLYTSLQNAVAKRLYRFLDKRFFHSDSFEMDLIELAVNRIGITASDHVGQIKRTLSKGIAELETKWDLKRLPAERRFERSPTNQWIVRFERKRHSRSVLAAMPAKPPLASEAEPSLLTALTRRGIGPAAAEEIIFITPQKTIRQMIELFDWYNLRGQSRGAGFLIQSIKKPATIVFPPEFESSDQIRDRQAAKNSRIATERKLSAERDLRSAAEQESRSRAFMAFWEGLSPAEQNEFEDAAVDATEPTKRTGYYRSQAKQDVLFEKYRHVILRDHFERTRK